MALSPLVEWLGRSSFSPHVSHVGGLSPAAKAYWGAIQAKKNPLLLWVAESAESAKALVTNLATFEVANVLYFPPSEVTAYEGISADEGLVDQRQRVRLALKQGQAGVVVTTGRGISQLLLPPEDWHTRILSLKPGQEIAPHTVAQSLVAMGYQPAPVVENMGEFGRRGDLMDVFSPGQDQAVRLEWFGDELESIRPFDPQSQRSTGILPQIDLVPCREFPLPLGWKGEAEKRAMMAEVAGLYADSPQQAALLRAKVEADLDRLGRGEPFDGDDFYVPFWYQPASLLDYLPTDTHIVWDEEQDLFRWQEEALTHHQRQRAMGESIELPHPLFIPAHDVRKRARDFSFQTVSSLPDGQLETLLPAISHKFDEMAQLLRDWTREGWCVVCATAQPQRLLTILRERDCPVQLDVPDAPQAGVWVTRATLNGGFAFPPLNLRLVTDAELFGWKTRPVKGAPKRQRHRMGERIQKLEELKPGAHVIHEAHGIGCFVGLTHKDVGGQSREYLEILYAKEDKLFVPVEQMNLISLYRGSGDDAPRLHKMGGVEWQNAKRRVKQSVEDLAEKLLDVYAKRARAAGYAFPPDTEWQREMEAAFPYDETPDQLTAIHDSKEDMEAVRPMDRLICGDVGFGKTEVALRAAFKAILAGKQVALLCPTTVLAQQHYDVFQERFAPYPVKVALLNRFRTPKESKQIKEELRKGVLDLVIGTHRILSKDLHFNDLGLLVIDEEHRFGVAQKEKIKGFAPHVDILSMSATPIPRTLNLALSGVRDMSLIQTPPENRLPIRTKIAAFSDDLVKNAILHELERGGQIYYVHNRVQTIGVILERLVELVPHARYGIAHGQLPEHELENVMLAFQQGEVDVLICTTVVENGLDIPRANTMLVDEADKMGLAQLYQLRGRVGRSDTQAFAYFLYRSDKPLTEDARQRLQAIGEMTSLGMGYQIAMRDLEIRGVGNLLGAEQHGHLISVGFDLYCDLLEEAVQALHPSPDHPPKAPKVLLDLNLPAYLPDGWVPDPRQKMQLYRRLAAVESMAELEGLAGECVDRYGTMPVPAQILWRAVKVRVWAAQLGIQSMVVDTKWLTISPPLHEETWRDKLAMNASLNRWRWKQTDLSTTRAATPEDNLRLVERLLEDLQRQPLVQEA